MHAECAPVSHYNRQNPCSSVRPNLSGQHYPISMSAACEIMEKMRSQDMPSKVLRFGVNDTAKPTSIPEHERTKAMLQRYNKYSQYHNYLTSIPQASDTAGKRRKKQEGFRVAKWVSASLPLSRSEAEAMGCTTAFIPLTTRAMGNYGPWQTQVLRHVNFPLVSQEVSRYEVARAKQHAHIILFIGRLRTSLVSTRGSRPNRGCIQGEQTFPSGLGSTSEGRLCDQDLYEVRNKSSGSNKMTWVLMTDLLPLSTPDVN